MAPDFLMASRPRVYMGTPHGDSPREGGDSPHARRPPSRTYMGTPHGDSPREGGDSPHARRHFERSEESRTDEAMPIDEYKPCI